MKTLSENTNKLWLMPVLTILAALTGYGTGNDWLLLLGTGGGIATLVPVLVELIKSKLWDFSGKTFLRYPVSRWATWVLSFMLCFLAYQINVIENFNLWYGIFYALLTGLVANRYFHWSDIEFLLALFAGRTEKVEKMKALVEAENEVLKNYK